MNTVRLVVCGFGISLLSTALFMPTTNAASTPSSTKYDELKTFRTESINSEITEKRTAIEQKIADKKAETNSRLEGERAAKCQARENSINHILQRRAEKAQVKLNKLTVIQDKLESIVATYGLTIENTTALTTIMDDRQANASAIIQATKTLTFECATTDATEPGKIAVDHVTSMREALKDYQTAIKDFITAIRESALQEKPRQDV
ncbi:hypothetical protein E6P97_01445 [Patescibacteria group bacterium]|nr:MAG: hypothetical protein E6P97_01445 [Patescibacteria group bacterium]